MIDERSAEAEAKLIASMTIYQRDNVETLARWTEEMSGGVLTAEPSRGVFGSLTISVVRKDGAPLGSYEAFGETRPIHGMLGGVYLPSYRRIDRRFTTVAKELFDLVGSAWREYLSEDERDLAARYGWADRYHVRIGGAR